MRVAVLSNINLQPLQSFLPAALAKDFPSIEGIHFGGYGQYLEELINPQSSLNAREFDVVLLHLEGEEFIKEISYTLMPAEQACKMVEEKINLLFNSLENYMKGHPGAYVVMTTIAFPPLTFLNYLDVNSEYSLRALEGVVNEQIIHFSIRLRSFYVLDWRSLVVRYGYETLIDERFWYLGRMKYTSKAYQVLAAEFQNLLRAIRGQAKKVLVLDLDNTLWGGLIGEDGLQGIQLSEEGLGKAYRDFQTTIKALTGLGILLAVNSKNNPADVDEVFASHPMMVLKKEDFVSVKINWNNKVENMEEIARELNLGLDSFVFLDDNPREREIIRQHLPQVTVSDFPQDPAHLKTWFLEDVVYAQFPKVFITAEDTRKSDQYKASRQRNELAQELDMDEFIKYLKIGLGLYINDRRFIQRASQLTQKTNQFNMTTRRYTPTEIERFMNDGEAIVFNLDYRDKFGTEGIIGTSIVKKRQDCGYLDSFLLSCRIIGRNVEYAFLYKIIQCLKDLNIRRVAAEFVPTPKNAVAGDFYKNVEFAHVEQKENSLYLQDTVTAVLENLRRKYRVEDLYG